MKGSLRQIKRKKRFLKELAEVPIISAVCKKVSLSRQTYYRWREEDTDFASEADRHLLWGQESVNDLAQSKLIQNISSGNMQAIKYWLSHNHGNYLKPREPRLHNLIQGNLEVTPIAKLFSMFPDVLEPTNKSTTPDQIQDESNTDQQSPEVAQ